MAREWLDYQFDGTTNPRLNFIDESGNAVLSNVLPQYASSVLQEGDEWRALAANRVTELSDAGVPMLAIDGGTANASTGWQTQRRQAGGALPATLRPGEFFVMDDGTIYVGDANGVPVQQAAGEDVTNAITQMQQALTAHIDDKSNPHETTAAQVGAPTTEAFNNHVNNFNNPHRVTVSQLGAAEATTVNNHINNRSNPHGVTAAQANAVAKTGDTMSGTLTIQRSGNGAFYHVYPNTPRGSRRVGMWQNNNGDFGVIETNADSGLLIVQDGSGTTTTLTARNFLTSASSREYKEDIAPASLDDAKKLLDLEISQWRYTQEYNDKHFASFPALKDRSLHVGPMAEDAAEISEDFIYRDNDGKIEGLKRDSFIAPMLQLIQDLYAQVDSLTERVEALQSEVEATRKK